MTTPLLRRVVSCGALFVLGTTLLVTSSSPAAAIGPTAPTGVRQIVTDSNSDVDSGTIIVGARDSANAVWVRQPNCESASCNNGGWVKIGGIITDLSVAVLADQRSLIVAGIGADGSVWTNRYACSGTCSWSGWTNFGGRASRIAIVHDRLYSTCSDIFVVGMDSAVWRRYYCAAGAGEESWNSLGGRVSEIAVSSFDGIWVAAIGTDGLVYTRHSQSETPTGYTGWSPTGGRLTTIDFGDATGPVLAGVSPDHVPYRTECATGTCAGGWVSIGGIVRTLSVNGGSSSSGVQYIAIGSDGAAWGNGVRYIGGWESLGGTVTQLKSASMYSSNGSWFQRMMFGIGVDGAVWSRTAPPGTAKYNPWVQF